MSTRRGMLVVAIAAAIAIWSASPALAKTPGHGGPSGHLDPHGASIGNQQGGSGGTPGGQFPGGAIHYPGPPQPVYKDYYTPACGINGPPGQDGGALCMAAVSVCKVRGMKSAIFMQHWHQEVSPKPGPWEFVGNECRGPDAPTQQQPQVTVDMVLDQAYAAAPKPTAVVQPGNRSFVNLPNNYYADAPSQTVPVVVLGQTIPVTFTVTDVKWDFGDGATADGKGVRDAALQQAGAIEHAYSAQGSYDITATSTMTVSFVIPGGGRQDIPGALEIPSAPHTLPIGEIQTRVDSAG